ncbi:MAG: ABC transporter permease [Nitrospirales bacterium]|nr:MAG: ABC transporter permease [Nitrospirales bacterium]
MIARHALLISALLFSLLPAWLYASNPHASVPKQRLVVGSKNFVENRLLAEMLAQLIEAKTTITVTRRLGLAGTQVAFEALKSGSIDLYPEYTGTGLVSILRHPPLHNPQDTLNHVRAEFLSRWNLVWMSPLGFENSYALAMSKRQAEELNIRTISDLTKISSTLRAGLGYEFVKRPDGIPGLQHTYGLTFKEIVTMQQTIKYQAADTGDVDVLDVYTTDGRLAVYDLQVLNDDRHFFPPYEAAVLIREDTLKRFPQLGTVLAALSNSLDTQAMQTLNLRLQEKGDSVTRVAHDALVSIKLLQAREHKPSADELPSSYLLPYLWEQKQVLASHALEHVSLAGLALILGILLAVPLGLVLERQRRLAEPLIRLIGMTQTIPSIALLAFMIPIFGIGALPAIMALWLYSLFPILRNTYTGLRDAAPSAVEAAKALGMTDWQILSWVRLPLSAPVIMSGIRTSAVITVGTTTLAAFIGAGGLGVPIVSGLQLANTTLILSGALPAALLALCVDGLLSMIERWVKPKGMAAR